MASMCTGKRSVYLSTKVFGPDAVLDLMCKLLGFLMWSVEYDLAFRCSIWIYLVQQSAVCASLPKIRVMEKVLDAPTLDLTINHIQKTANVSNRRVPSMMASLTPPNPSYKIHPLWAQNSYPRFLERDDQYVNFASMNAANVQPPGFQHRVSPSRLRGQARSFYYYLAMETHMVLEDNDGGLKSLCLQDGHDCWSID